MKCRLGGVLLLVVTLVLGGTAVRAQEDTGSLSGRVIDTAGRPIPGASVQVTCTYLQGPRGAVTNSMGEFLIPYLPPASDYKTVFEAAGFNKVVQSSVKISLGTTTSLQVALTSGGEELTVTARPAVMTHKGTQVSTNITQQEMETIPIGRHYQDTLYLAPMVTPSGMGGNPGVAGSTGSENIFLINGLNTTDPVMGTFGTNLNYNFIREMEITTGGMQAEYGASTGGVFNILTKSGTNEFHGELFAYYTDESFTANRHSNDLSTATNSPYHNYDYGFDVGGPIVKDRLWFFVGYNPTLFSRHYEGSMTAINYGSNNPDTYLTELHIPYKYDNISRNWLWSAKFTYRVNDKHNLELSVFSDPSHLWQNEGPFPSIDRRALQTRRYQGGYNGALRWYASWSPSLFSDTGFGKTHSRLDILPWDHAGFGRPEILSADYSPYVSLGAGIGNYIWDDRDSTQFQTKWTLLAGKHEVKFGGQVEELKWNSYSDYTGGYKRLLIYQRPNHPLTTNPVDYGYTFDYRFQNPQSCEKGTYTAIFAQDSWSATDFLTLSYGIRFERNEVKPGNGGQKLSLDSWSPRVGIDYDFMHNGKSKVYANWGRFYQRVPISMSQSMDPGHATYRDFYYAGGYQYTDVYGSVPTTVLGGVKNQYTDEFMAGVEYELRPDLTVGFNATFRRLGRVLEDVGYIDNSGNISYILMNPGEQWPAIMSRWASEVPDYERFPRAIRNYDAYVLKLNKRFSNNWFLNVSYTWSTLRGNYEGGSGGYGLAGLSPDASSAYDIPESILINNRYGYLPQDIRHSLKIQGSYRLDWGLVLGMNFDLRSGRPLNQEMDYPYNEIGYGTVLTAPRGTDRLPGVWQLDLHAEYDMKLWKTDLALFVDVFNVTNRQTALTKYETYWRAPDNLQQILKGTWFTDKNKNGTLANRDYNWGLTTARQGSRNARIGVKWSF